MTNHIVIYFLHVINFSLAAYSIKLNIKPTSIIVAELDKNSAVQ